MRRTTRGSVAVMAMIMVVSSMMVAIVMVSLSGAVRTKQTRLEANRVVKNAYDGGLDYVRDLAERGVLRMPQLVKIDIGGVQESLTLTDVSSASVSLGGVNITTSAPTILVDGTLSYGGASYHLQTVLGRGHLSTVWQYAIYDDSKLTTATSIVTGETGYEGDAWFGGNITLTNPATHFGGDLTSQGVILPLSISVSGNTTALSPAITFPTVTPSAYQSSAAIDFPSNTTLNGYTFQPPTASGDYPLVFCGPGLTLSGNFSGSGVIFVNGSATISGDITTGPNDHLVIIVDNNLTIAATAKNIHAYIYCGGATSIDASASLLTIESGWVTKDMTPNRDILAAFDPYLRDHPTEAYRLKLPGVWP